MLATADIVVTTYDVLVQETREGHPDGPVVRVRWHRQALAAHSEATVICGA